MSDLTAAASEHAADELLALAKDKFHLEKSDSKHWLPRHDA